MLGILHAALDERLLLPTVDFKPLSAEDLDALLEFLEPLARPGFVAGHWVTEKGMLPFFVSAPELGAFVRAAYEHGFVVPFNWPDWREEADRLLADPSALAEADLATIRKLITGLVRAERFSEGTLAEASDNGQLVAVLRRLKTIREKLGRPA